jgi:hypothetical protein
MPATIAGGQAQRFVDADEGVERKIELQRVKVVFELLAETVG